MSDLRFVDPMGELSASQPMVRSKGTRAVGGYIRHPTVSNQVTRVFATPSPQPQGDLSGSRASPAVPMRTRESGGRGSSTPTTTSPMHHETYHHNQLLRQQPSWRFSRSTAPVKVLDAQGAVNEAYMQALHWGRSRLAVSLGSTVLHFDPVSPMGFVSISHESVFGKTSFNDGMAGSAPSPARPEAMFTAVAMMPREDDRVAVADGAGRAAVVDATRATPSTKIGKRIVEPEFNVNVVCRFDTSAGSTTSADDELRALAALGPAGGDVCPHRIACMDTVEEQPDMIVMGSGRGCCMLFDVRAGARPVMVLRPPCPPTMLFDPDARATASARGGAGYSGGAGRRQHAMSMAANPNSFGPELDASLAPFAALLQDEVTSVKFSPSGSMVGCGTNGGTVAAWSLSMPSSPVVFEPALHHGAVRALAWNPIVRGELLSGGGLNDGAICVVRADRNESGRASVLAKTDTQVCQLAFSDDGRLLISSHGWGRHDTGLPESVTFDSAASMGEGGSKYLVGADEPPITANVRRNTLCVWELARGGSASPSVRHVSPSLSPMPEGATRTALREVGNSRLDGKPLPPSSPVELGSISTPSCSLNLVSTLRGHTSRPLHLARPQGQGTGMCASMAAGDDNTIRFWNPFELCSKGNGASPSSVSSTPPVTPQQQNAVDSGANSLPADPNTSHHSVSSSDSWSTSHRVDNVLDASILRASGEMGYQQDELEEESPNSPLRTRSSVAGAAEAIRGMSRGSTAGSSSGRASSSGSTAAPMSVPKACEGGMETHDYLLVHEDLR